jgi:hypothetical protein
MEIPARRGSRAGTLLVLFLTLFLSSAGGHAQSPHRSPSLHPPTVFLLASNLTWADLRPDGPLHDLRQLAETGSIALLNTAVSGEATEAAAFLSIGAGERVAAPGTRGPRIAVEDVPLTVADIAAEVYPAKGLEGNAVRPVYYRRFGRNSPQEAIGLAMGLPTLERIQPSPSRIPLLGALGEALQNGGRKIAVFGDWRSVLVGMDRKGAVYQGSVITEVLPNQLPQTLSKTDVVIASVSGPRALRRLTRTIAPLVQQGDINLIVVNGAPPISDTTGKWSRLGWIVAVGPDFPSHTVLTSATTRTPGLVANVDIAPTILALQDLSPFSGGAGHKMQTIPSSDSFKTLDRLDRQTIAAVNAAGPLLIPYGVLAIGITLASLVCLWFGVGKAPARFGLLVISAVLLALLPVGYIAPVNPWYYSLSVLGLSLILSLAANLLGARFHLSPIGLLFSVLAAVICIDAVLGSPLVSSDLLSDFYLTGIRFYGLGNEYTGFLLGAVMTGWGLAPLSSPSRERAVLISLGIVTTLLIGLPWFGADAGGALAATVLFILAALPGRLRARHIMGAFAGAFGVVLLLALVDRLRGSAETHIGGALAAGQSHGFGAIWDIIVRKIVMNVGISVSPLTLAVIAGMIPIWLLLTRGRISERLQQLLSERPKLYRALVALLWGAFASAAFNDSGIAMALLLLAPPTTAVIHEMLSE